ncbi:type I-C CRISPR-associated protein Cas8c/Csd1 [Cellvibrio japonicus]|uniref:CRISPR-associated protein, Csd1 family n=1 Tax=Cellvibrio japonicus (strain Ueda107) TaxID=498211 RepID=B3PKI7_CELJU|nr:type I-C CRISPR-associated protein Cas8c/Csd1 [Cellvibrio japonicus]ACE84720.1 CRISPR-associated protein, Csd1 family [Cellvibrio japonicus Ueda107]QEI12851.1 type I-C CRISPR-associated protein Cas8c/Csd1 [Cellvibrio japonicus]QEI16425.1 type I-C CRISPR-associated protein Cas8c/Csd1 [Cellvibrio japonicus]QEI20003.1 type I-C CRISPR-associated protein Cas8c/Csd1 [Cellvibrio japonicus]
MSWMAKLYETYENAMTLDLPEEKQLMPTSHTMQNAHINIQIDFDGNFIGAKVLEKTQIILPATERSAGRSSGEAPHPLADKLQYVAADYEKFGGQKSPYFKGYQSQIRDWCDSRFGHPKVQAVCNYISKQTVIEDLIGAKVCYVGENNKLLTSWPFDISDENPLPLLFKTLPKEKGELDQGNAMVCWSVITPGDLFPDTWKDNSIQQSWIAFDAEDSGGDELCYVSGRLQPSASNHPAKLRHTGDKAKLVSANDTSGFTFRGRFIGGEQVANVGFEITQKAHNTLRWLIANQSSKNGDQVVVAWAVSGKPIPAPLVPSLDLDNFDEVVDGGKDILVTETDITSDLGQNFAKALNRYMAGYFDGRIASLKEHESIVIMGLDSATPGRMAIIYYRDFMAKDYVQTIEKWHSHLAWPQRVSTEVELGNKKKAKVYWPVSAPSPWNILQAAYGDVVKSNEELKKSLYERIMPCILEGRALPIDIVNLAISRASNRNNSEHWEWERNLGVACALYRGLHHPERQPDSKKRREYVMSLDMQYTGRDYLFGRLLAVAERIEEMAMVVASEPSRSTHASRLMQRFADRPASTWLNIHKALAPYQQRLRAKLPPLESAYSKLLDDISAAFIPADFSSEKRLSGEYLLGFHCQRKWLREHKLEKGMWISKSTEETELTINEGEQQ